MTTETDTTVLTGPFEQARGVIGREPTGDERYIFKFDSTQERSAATVDRPRERTREHDC